VLALEQLADVELAARVLGLQTLPSIATSKDVRITISLLSDSEPRVVVAAALVLRQVTGQDFGIRLSQALPHFFGMGTNAPPPPDLNAIGQGVHRWQDWWARHHAEYPAAQFSHSRSKPVAGLTTDDFGLADSNGKSVRLSDYRGKSVLLAFWSPDSPASLDAASELAALHQANPERLAVLGICVPPASSCRDEHEPKTERANHRHHHDEASSSSANPAHALDQIQELALEHKITCPVLLDSKGAIGLRFAIENLPTYVLVDAQGIVRRRFVGTRSKQVLEAMIDEVSGTNPEHALKPSAL
jgi:peroxiredoxin